MLKMMISGNLCGDPDVKYMNDGSPVCNFTVASNRKLHNGQKAADFVRVAVWGKMAEICGQYLAKGKKVLCVGRPSARGYVSQSGDARASLELVASEIEFLSSVANAASVDSGAEDSGVGEYEEYDGEVPF